MATWTNITNAALEPGKPIRSVDGLALRDNPIAITEGASGAPKIQNAALDDDVIDDRTLTGTATTVGRDWVLARTALAAVGTVGTYAFLARSSTGVGFSEGDVISGGVLGYAGVNIDNLTVNVNWDGSLGASPAGSWRAMGESAGRADEFSASLFLRIA